MTHEARKWVGPLTPWQVVQKRFFHGVDPDADSFAKKHSLDPRTIKDVFSGKRRTLDDDLCRILSQETGMSEQFFRNLSVQDGQRMQAA